MIDTFTEKCKESREYFDKYVEPYISIIDNLLDRVQEVEFCREMVAKFGKIRTTDDIDLSDPEVVARMKARRKKRPDIKENE